MIFGYLGSLPELVVTPVWGDPQGRSGLMCWDLKSGKETVLFLNGSKAQCEGGDELLPSVLTTKVLTGLKEALSTDMPHLVLAITVKVTAELCATPSTT